ncbi:hypothetical protein BsWGS_24361 [Bradybaena similaris]
MLLKIVGCEEAWSPIPVGKAFDNDGVIADAEDDDFVVAADDVSDDVVVVDDDDDVDVGIIDDDDCDHDDVIVVIVVVDNDDDKLLLRYSNLPAPNNVTLVGRASKPTCSSTEPLSSFGGERF